MKEPIDQPVTFRLTRDERAMLRTLAVRSTYGSEQGLLRALIREAWKKRLTSKHLKELRPTSATKGTP